MISNSIPVSFLCCCLFFLPRSDNLLSVVVERGILHWVWRVAGLFSGDSESWAKPTLSAKLKSPRSSILYLHISPNAARHPQRGTYSCFFQRRGSQTLGSFTAGWINERGKRNTAGKPISLLFDLVIQSYKVIVNTVISVFWVGVKHSFKDTLKAVKSSFSALDYSNRSKLASQSCITEGARFI